MGATPAECAGVCTASSPSFARSRRSAFCGAGIQGSESLLCPPASLCAASLSSNPENRRPFLARRRRDAEPRSGGNNTAQARAQRRPGYRASSIAQALKMRNCRHLGRHLERECTPLESIRRFRRLEKETPTMKKTQSHEIEVLRTENQRTIRAPSFPCVFALLRLCGYLCSYHRGAIGSLSILNLLYPHPPRDPRECRMGPRQESAFIAKQSCRVGTAHQSFSARTSIEAWWAVPTLQPQGRNKPTMRPRQSIRAPRHSRSDKAVSRLKWFCDL